MPLSNVTILNAPPKEKVYKLFDGGGLYVEILPSGGKYWRIKSHLGIYSPPLAAYYA